MKTPLLFRPDDVRKTLERLPSLAAKLPDPAEVGADSEAWPGVVRKTDLEIYRWLANVENYDHLAEVVALLERASAGLTFDGLLKTRSREQFASHTSELLLADDLLDRGYQVTTIARTGDVTPDLHVQGEGIDMAVEVYTPRELRAVDAFVSDVKDLLLNVDVAADYAMARTGTDMQKTIPPEPHDLDPWAPDKFLEQTGEEVFEEIAEDVQSALSELRPFEKDYRHGNTPLVTTVEIEDVRPSSEVGPARHGSLTYPGFGGYSPAGVFRLIVERALKKAKKRQTSGVDASARALVVDLTKTEIADDLARSEAHLREAKTVVEGIDPQEYGLDVISFSVRALPRGLAAVLSVVEDSTVSPEAANAMFGRRS